MKALPFNVIKLQSESFKVEIEDQKHFYDYLHTHPEIQLTIIISSTGTLVGGNFIESFKPGDAFLLGSNMPHFFKNDAIYYSEDSEQNAKAISIFLRSDVLSPGFLHLPELNLIKQLIEKSKHGIKFDGVTALDILSLAEQIIEAENTERIILLLKLLDLASRSKKLNALSKDVILNFGNELEGERFSNILHFTLTEFQNPISLDKVAAVANMTTNSFCRYFKKKTRKSYVTFLNELRINNACIQLKNKDLSVSDIAFQSGFNNITNFNKQFKVLMGIAPRDYRKKLD